MPLFRTLLTSAGFALAAGLAPAAGVAQPSGPPAAVVSPDVDPAALLALQRMSAYLGSLTTFEIQSQTSVELVLDDGQKLELDGATRHRVRRPDGFFIEASTDRKARQFFYDGRTFTLNAPELGYYATVPAPPTIRQTLDAAYDRYGVSLPLEDLFRWSDPNTPRSSLLRSGIFVGAAKVDGVECDHYAFREGDLDWQIWIQRGDRPLPRKLVIVDRLDDAHPEFTALLDWEVNPRFAADAFTFRPGPNAKLIRFAGGGQ